jgi:general secretion pathway protein C
VNTVDTSALKARYRDALNEVASRANILWLTYARDSRKLSRLQTGIIALLVFWSISSVSQLIWIPFRTSAIETAPAAAINPPRAAAQNPAQSVDVSRVLGSGLFGAGPDLPLEAAENGTAASGQRDGIEQNAKETRLALSLTGIVALAENGLGSAVIKSGATEQVYAVGDALPASGQVVLSKVMPEQVVIDNNGTYELIKLYDKPGLSIPSRPSTQGSSAVKSSTQPSQPNARASEQSVEQSGLASQYRARLYENPESLAQVVSVAPVRGNDGIVGYRITPGQDRAAFDAFGFKAGDVVTAVNGLALSDASNSIKLYQMMKDATLATFDINRDDGSVTISVDLAGP